MGHKLIKYFEECFFSLVCIWEVGSFSPLGSGRFIFSFTLKSVSARWVAAKILCSAFTFSLASYWDIWLSGSEGSLVQSIPEICGTSPETGSQAPRRSTVLCRDYCPHLGNTELCLVPGVGGLGGAGGGQLFASPLLSAQLPCLWAGPWW